MSAHDTHQAVLESYARTIYAGLMFRLKMRAIREKQGK